MPRVKVPVPVEEKKEAPAPAPPPVAEPEPIPEPAPAPPTPPREPRQPFLARFSSQQKLIMVFGAVILVMFIIMLSLLNSRNDLKDKVSGSSSSSAKDSNQQLSQLTSEIGKYFVLPTGETPTLATVTDISKVSGQAFFKNAHNGDKVLLYSKAGTAILYRPSVKKIVNVAAVDLGSGSNTTGTTPAAQ